MTETTSPQTETLDRPCQCARFVAVVNGQDDDLGATWELHDSTGCHATTKRDFAQGHDAKLKSALIKWGHRDLDIMDRATSEVTSALRVANRYGFGYMVSQGIARLNAQQEARQAKADAKHEAKAAKAPVSRETDVEVDEPAPLAERIATIKIGRWTYPATIDSDGVATYRTKLSGTKTAEAGTFTEI